MLCLFVCVNMFICACVGGGYWGVYVSVSAGAVGGRGCVCVCVRKGGGLEVYFLACGCVSVTVLVYVFISSPVYQQRHHMKLCYHWPVLNKSREKTR